MAPIAPTSDYSFFAGKRVFVTGGTGSFGHQIIKRILGYDPAEVTVFSRDEKKQYDMRDEYRHSNRMRFVIGDVRSYERLRAAMRGHDIVFHAAALKQVPSTEDAPFEAVLTNVVGAENIRRAVAENSVEVVVAISTDKAVKPVNVMGMTKALQERIVLNPQEKASGTRFVCVRYGNVLGSRGSVVPLFHRRILRGLPLPITDENMTRFLLTLDEAVGLVIEATLNGNSGELWVRKMPASRVVDLGQVLARGLTGVDSYPTEVVGIRPGEKLHEVLVSEEEMRRSREVGDHFVIEPWVQRSPNGFPDSSSCREYSSDSVGAMSEADLMSMLDSEGWLSREPVRHGY